MELLSPPVKCQHLYDKARVHRFQLTEGVREDPVRTKVNLPQPPKEDGKNPKRIEKRLRINRHKHLHRGSAHHMSA